MRLKDSRLTAVAALAMLAAGCLQKETTHTLVLSPSGEVTWITAENNVYSDAREPSGRRSEEQEYVAAAVAGRHPTGLALEAMAPVGPVRTRILRDEAPFLVVTDARFDSIETVMQRLFEQALAVGVNLTGDGKQSALTVGIDCGVDVVDSDSPVSAVLNDLDRLRIVMSGGHFVSATGFELADGTVATFSDAWMKEAERTCEAKGATRLTLTWETGPV
jgi:hypothetical protein